MRPRHRNRRSARRYNGLVSARLASAAMIESHQAGEPLVEVVLAQPGVAPGALDPLGKEARLAQDAQVMGESRLGQREAGLLHDLRAPGLAVARHLPHGRKPVRSASAARMRGSWKSAAAGSTTSSITPSRIGGLAWRSEGKPRLRGQAHAHRREGGAQARSTTATCPRSARSCSTQRPASSPAASTTRRGARPGARGRGEAPARLVSATAMTRPTASTWRSPTRRPASASARPCSTSGTQATRAATSASSSARAGATAASAPRRPGCIVWLRLRAPVACTGSRLRSTPSTRAPAAPTRRSASRAEGVLRESLRYNGEWIDATVMSILAPE